MLQHLVTMGGDPAADPAMQRAIEAHAAAVRASARGGDRGLVALAEAAVKADPGAFTFDAAGMATLRAAGHAWSAGRFELVSLRELRRRATEARSAAAATSSPRAHLWVVGGAAPATDIGSLQASAGEGTLFQVASQFNCLESPGPYLTDVTRYLTDPTQGPRASISAFPATLLRHYAAPGPGGARFVQQTDGPQIDLLRDVFEGGEARSRNGYLTADCVAAPSAFVTALHDRFEAIQVGVHDGAEVVLGYDWDGAVTAPAPRIAQVFTSTVAGGGYGGEQLGSLFEPACRQLLRAAYLGTLLSAASLGKSRAVLTLIGGGVFGNPVHLIWDAIVWATAEVEPCLASDLHVVVNGRDLASRMDPGTILAEVRARSGALLAFDRAGVPALLR